MQTVTGSVIYWIAYGATLGLLLTGLFYAGRAVVRQLRKLWRLL